MQGGVLCCPCQGEICDGRCTVWGNQVGGAPTKSKTSAVYYLIFSRGPHGNSFTGNPLSMKWFEMTWRDECNDSWEKVDIIFDRFFIKRIGLRFLIQHPGLVAVWKSLKQHHCSDKLSQLLAGHVVPCRTLKPLAIFNRFDDWTTVSRMTTMMILCLPIVIP